MAFDYYDRLTTRQQRTYRRSDSITTVDLPDAVRFSSAVGELGEALEAEKPRPVQRAAQRLCRGLADGLGVSPFDVKVLSRRPNRYGGELHGLYEREEGKRALITVWMKTSAQKRVVAFRTFLRTLLHEVCHHLDFELYDLPDTFHTEGFFKRESSLLRALAPAPSKPRRKAGGRGERPGRGPARARRPGRGKADGRALAPVADEAVSALPRKATGGKAMAENPGQPNQLGLFPDDS